MLNNAFALFLSLSGIDRDIGSSWWQCEMGGLQHLLYPGRCAHNTQYHHKLTYSFEVIKCLQYSGIPLVR